MDIINQAVWVHQHANIEYFERLLSAFQTAAIDKGFVFVEGTKQCILSDVELDHFGRAIHRAKNRFLAPRAPESQLEHWTENAVEDGNTMNWVHTILNGLQKRNIVLKRAHQRVSDAMTVAPLGPQLSVVYQAQRDAFEAFVRGGTSPVPASEVDRPLPDGSYRTSAANAGWAFWQAAQASLTLGTETFTRLREVYADVRPEDLTMQAVQKPN